MGVAPADTAAILERYRDAFNRHDVDAWVELFHPDVVMVPTAYWAPPGTTYRGKAGLRSYAHEVFSRMPYLNVEKPEVRDLGDYVLQRVTIVAGRDRASATAETIVVLYTLKDGQIFRAEGFATEEEAIEVAERESPAQFRLLFEHASDAVVLSDDKGVVVDANVAACNVYGLTLQELRGRGMREFAPPEDVGRLDQLLYGLRAGAQVSSGESRIVSATGDRHAVELRARPDFLSGRHLIVLTPSTDGSEPAQSERAGPPRLTPREREVFRLLALGFSGSEVAEQLVLSPHTVRRHVEKGIARLEAKNRVQAIAIALTSGEIQL